jgi:hypothetical protein
VLERQEISYRMYERARTGCRSFAGCRLWAVKALFLPER